MKKPLESLSAEETYDRGYKYKEKYKQHEAFECFLYAANKGHIQSQINVAKYYYLGSAPALDKKKAVCWYEQAALQNDLSALYKLYKIYYCGDAGEKNYEKALYWCEKAAESNDPRAQLYTGRMYEHGQGCKENKKTALY